MSIVSVRNSSQQRTAFSGTKTGLIWHYNNGTVSQESNKADVSGANLFLGKALNASGTRSLAREVCPVPNARAI